MAVRKSERRLPPGLEPGDLGQAVVAADGRCALISFATAPVIVARDNAYVVLVTDAALTSGTQSFEWTFTENGEVVRVDTTEFDEPLYQPSIIAAPSLAVRVLDAGNPGQATVSLKHEWCCPAWDKAQSPSRKDVTMGRPSSYSCHPSDQR